MLNPENIGRIRQKKMDALVAIQLHQKKKRELQKKNQLVDCLSIAVPVFYLTPRFLAKNTVFAPYIDILGEILAAILLVLAILKLVNKWQDDEIKHKTMLRKDHDTVYEANRLLESPTTNSEVVEQFLRRVIDVDNDDSDLFSNIKKTDKQQAYREALKEFDPSSHPTPCHVCGADPWKFIQGNCQACGGTPVK
jgi:mobilome CxxCx(11)CxxC protein